MSLSNIQLDQMARDLNIPLISVSFKDQIPYPPREGVYIVNLQSSTQGNGTHWSGIILNRAGSIYFDSFGELPPKEVQKFIQTLKDPKRLPRCPNFRISFGPKYLHIMYP